MYSLCNCVSSETGVRSIVGLSAMTRKVSSVANSKPFREVMPCDCKSSASTCGMSVRVIWVPGASSKANSICVRRARSGI